MGSNEKRSSSTRRKWSAGRCADGTTPRPPLPQRHTHTYTHPTIHSQPRQVECSRLRRLPPLPAAEMETERRGERKKLKLHPHAHTPTHPATHTHTGQASLGKESQEHFLLRLSKRNNRVKVHSQEKKLKPSSQVTSSFKKKETGRKGGKIINSKQNKTKQKAIEAPMQMKEKQQSLTVFWCPQDPPAKKCLPALGRAAWWCPGWVRPAGRPSRLRPLAL